MLVQKDYPGHRRQSSFCRQCSASIRRVPVGLPKSINSRIINNQKSLLEIHNLGAGWKQRQTIDNAINMVGEVFPKFAVQIRICSALWIDTKSYRTLPDHKSRTIHSKSKDFEIHFIFFTEESSAFDLKNCYRKIGNPSFAISQLCSRSSLGYSP